MPNNEEMTWVEHLAELRRRLIWIVAVLVVAMVGGFFAAVPVLEYIKSTPPANGLAWHAFSPGDGIRVYIQFAFFISIGVTLPYILYHVWAFVKPGLKPEEQRATLKYIPLSAVLFLTGFVFAYFVVFRFAIAFTMQLNASMNLTEMYGITQYLTFMINIVLPVSLLFELPVVVMFLTKLRLLNPIRLRKMRRYAYMALVVISTLIAPPDFVSNILILIPMILLYEISVILSGRIYRVQLEKDKAWEEEYGPK